jgi:hypothetical protein
MDAFFSENEAKFGNGIGFDLGNGKAMRVSMLCKNDSPGFPCSVISTAWKKRSGP